MLDHACRGESIRDQSIRIRAVHICSPPPALRSIGAEIASISHTRRIDDGFVRLDSTALGVTGSM